MNLPVDSLTSVMELAGTFAIQTSPLPIARAFGPSKPYPAGKVSTLPRTAAGSRVTVSPSTLVTHSPAPAATALGPSREYLLPRNMRTEGTLVRADPAAVRAGAAVHPAARVPPVQLAVRPAGSARTASMVTIAISATAVALMMAI